MRFGNDGEQKIFSQLEILSGLSNPQAVTSLPELDRVIPSAQIDCQSKDSTLRLEDKERLFATDKMDVKLEPIYGSNSLV